MAIWDSLQSWDPFGTKALSTANANLQAQKNVAQQQYGSGYGIAPKNVMGASGSWGGTTSSLSSKLSGGGATGATRFSGGGTPTPSYSTTQQPSGSSWEDQQRSMAEEQARIELEQAMSEYDRQAELGQNQIGALEQEQTGTLSGIETMRGRATKEATTAKEEAESATQKQKGKALGTAQDVQKTNRNVLRALGILSSSAAGEMLTKPMTEYGTQAGELSASLIKRKQQVDDWLMQRGQDFDSEVSKVKNQYANLINNIRTDLRYNGEQRALAVRAASSALQSKLSEISQTAMTYQQAAREYNNNILSQIAQIQLYQNPNADITGILSTMLNAGVQTPYSQSAAMTLSDEQRKKLLSGY